MHILYQPYNWGYRRSEGWSNLPKATLFVQSHDWILGFSDCKMYALSTVGRKEKERKWSRSVIFDSLRPHGHQAPPSMGFSRQEYWGGLPFPSPGNFLAQGLNPGLPHCRQTPYCLSHQGSHCWKKVTLISYLWVGNGLERQWRRQGLELPLGDTHDLRTWSQGGSQH